MTWHRKSQRMSPTFGPPTQRTSPAFWPLPQRTSSAFWPLPQKAHHQPAVWLVGVCFTAFRLVLPILDTGFDLIKEQPSTESSKKYITKKRISLLTAVNGKAISPIDFMMTIKSTSKNPKVEMKELWVFRVVPYLTDFFRWFDGERIVWTRAADWTGPGVSFHCTDYCLYFYQHKTAINFLRILCLYGFIPFSIRQNA